MGEIQKFLFDRRFDRPASGGQDWAPPPPAEPDPPPEPEEPPPPPPPMFTTAELESARQEGYICGHTAALEEANAATERMTALALADLAGRFAGLRDELATIEEDMARDVARLTLALCRKILPTTADLRLVREIVHLVTQALPQVISEPRLTVRAHPDLVDSLRAALADATATSGYEGRLVVAGDDSLDRPDCRIEWSDGGLERNGARQWAEIDALVEGHLAAIHRVAGPHDDPPEVDAVLAPEPTPAAEPGPEPAVLPDPTPAAEPPSQPGGRPAPGGDVMAEPGGDPNGAAAIAPGSASPLPDLPPPTPASPVDGPVDSDREGGAPRDGGGTDQSAAVTPSPVAPSAAADSAGAGGSDRTAAESAPPPTPEPAPEADPPAAASPPKGRGRTATTDGRRKAARARAAAARAAGETEEDGGGATETPASAVEDSPAAAAARRSP